MVALAINQLHTRVLFVTPVFLDMSYTAPALANVVVVACGAEHPPAVNLRPALRLLLFPWGRIRAQDLGHLETKPSTPVVEGTV